MTLQNERDLFRYVARDVVGKIGFVDCIIYLVDDLSQSLHQVAAIGGQSGGERSVVDALVLPISEGLTGYAARLGEPVLVGDTREDARFVQDGSPALSELCVPFFSDGKIAGVIDCEHPDLNAFTEFHLEVLTTIASLISANLSELDQQARMARRTERLAGNERRLALAMQGANDGLFDWDQRTGDIYYSPRWLSILGYEPGELPGTIDTFRTRLHPDDVDRTITYPAKMMELGREAIESEFRMKHKDGHWVDILSRAFVVHEDGVIKRLVGTHTDITDKKKHEQALQNSANLMREALRVARMASWTGTPDGALIWSPEVFDLLKMRPSDFDGTSENFYEFIHPSDRERVSDVVRHAQKHLSRYEVTYRVFDGAGQLISLRETAEIFRDRDGTHLRTAGAFLDITEQVEMQSKFNQAQKMEAIGQLTGGVAHDFNNLLAVIQGCAELMQISGSYEEELMDRILAASRRGSDLTHRLLAFARRQPLAPKTIDVDQLCQGMRQMLRRTFVETIDFKVTVPAGLWQARADQSQVEDALLNLAINARDAMPDGGVLEIQCRNIRLTEEMASATRDAQPGDYVCISVSDTGSGMTDQVQKHAFEPFFSTKEVGKGSGLGLSMVYGFATQSGGHVTLDSMLGKGTTVSIFLPRDKIRHDEEDATSEASYAPGQGETVLIVEDDPMVRQLALRMVMRLGYTAISAEDAHSARDVLASGQTFDILLSDVVLPGGVSGPEIAKEVTEVHPDVRVVFMSGYPADFAGGLEPGQVLLGKPFRWEELAHALRRALKPVAP
jgi:PAS domain S-box-containing protein